MARKAYLHCLIDELPDSDVIIVERLLEALCTTPRREFSIDNAPIDDEPETPEEAAAVAEAYEDIKAGRLISHEDLEREFGLS